MAHEVFGHNQFLGNCENRWSAGGFSVSRLFPTVPEDQVAEHTHSEAHFVLVMDGRYVSSAVQFPQATDSPILIYNPPGTRHRDRFRDGPGEFLTVAVPASVLRGFADAVALPDHPCVLDAQGLSVATRLVRIGPLAASRDDLVTESLCFELLIAAAKKSANSQIRKPNWLWRARELMHDDCGATLSLTEIAAAVEVHPIYLIRAFKRYFGCTPGDYLRRCRLQKAADMLMTDRRNLLEISQECGYFDQAHFSRTFKAAFGMSPRLHRQQKEPRIPSMEGPRFVRYKKKSGKPGTT